jgi:hypothetical protein
MVHVLMVEGLDVMFASEIRTTTSNNKEEVSPHGSVARNLLDLWVTNSHDMIEFIHSQFPRVDVVRVTSDWLPRRTSKKWINPQSCAEKTNPTNVELPLASFSFILLLLRSLLFFFQSNITTMKVLSLTALLFSSAAAFAPASTHSKVTTSTTTTTTPTTLFNDYQDPSAYVGDLAYAYVAPANVVVEPEEDVPTFIPPKHHDVIYGNLYTRKQGVAYIQGGSTVDFRIEYEG